MSDIKDGGPAFRMTLRDYFAAKALPAIYSEAMAEYETTGLFSYPDWRTGLALDAYEMADAMLKARGEQ